MGCHPGGAASVMRTGVRPFPLSGWKTLHPRMHPCSIRPAAVRANERTPGRAGSLNRRGVSRYTDLRGAVTRSVTCQLLCSVKSDRYTSPVIAFSRAHLNTRASFSVGFVTAVVTDPRICFGINAARLNRNQEYLIRRLFSVVGNPPALAENSGHDL